MRGRCGLRGAVLLWGDGGICRGSFRDPWQVCHRLGRLKISPSLLDCWLLFFWFRCGSRCTVSRLRGISEFEFGRDTINGRLRTGDFTSGRRDSKGFLTTLHCMSWWRMRGLSTVAPPNSIWLRVIVGGSGSDSFGANPPQRTKLLMRERWRRPGRITSGLFMRPSTNVMSSEGSYAVTKPTVELEAKLDNA